MNSYTSLFTQEKEGQHVDYGQPLAPVRVGQIFRLRNNARCVVTKLLPNCFEYEFVNPRIRKPYISSMRITYRYWRNNTWMGHPLVTALKRAI